MCDRHFRLPVGSRRGNFHTRLFFPLVHWEFSTRNICTRRKKSLVWKISTTRSDWQSEMAATHIQILIYYSTFIQTKASQFKSFRDQYGIEDFWTETLAWLREDHRGCLEAFPTNSPIFFPSPKLPGFLRF